MSLPQVVGMGEDLGSTGKGIVPLAVGEMAEPKTHNT